MKVEKTKAIVLKVRRTKKKLVNEQVTTTVIGRLTLVEEPLQPGELDAMRKRPRSSPWAGRRAALLVLFCLFCVQTVLMMVEGFRTAQFDIILISLMFVVVLGAIGLTFFTGMGPAKTPEKLFRRLWPKYVFWYSDPLTNYQLHSERFSSQMCVSTQWLERAYQSQLPVRIEPEDLIDHSLDFITQAVESAFNDYRRIASPEYSAATNLWKVTEESQSDDAVLISGSFYLCRRNRDNIRDMDLLELRVQLYLMKVGKSWGPARIAPRFQQPGPVEDVSIELEEPKSDAVEQME